MAERALTLPPPFDIERYARESEDVLEAAPNSTRDTEPPPPEHASLRESCRDLKSAIAPQVTEHTSGVIAISSTPALGAVAVPLVSPEDYDWFELDERSRAIVALVDDNLIVEEILAATHTPISDGIAVFAKLASLGLVGFRAVT